MTTSSINRFEIGILSSLSQGRDKNAFPQGLSQWWYFDALSDNGEDTVVVDFIATPSTLDNNSTASSGKRDPFQKMTVSFEYYRKGRLLYRAACEYSPDSFETSPSLGVCRIGDSYFEFGSADYGEGYSLRLDLPMARGRRLRAGLEWLFIESDLLSPGSESGSEEKSTWNVVAPRADVTGRFEVSDRNGKTIDTCHFRGSGYHDHRSGPVNFLENFSVWTWGRIHFPDSTAMYLFAENADVTISKLLVIRDSSFHIYDAACKRENPSHDLLGIKYDRRLIFSSDDGIELVVDRVRPLCSGIYMLRFVCDMDLQLKDRKSRSGNGIAECIAPGRLRRSWIARLTGMFSHSRSLL